MGKVSYYHTAFIAGLAKELGIHEKTCVDNVIAISDIIGDWLHQGHKVAMRGFGSFHVTKCVVRHHIEQAHNNKRCSIVYRPSTKLVTKHHD